ncbi:MAG: hypothetical protein IIZ25_08900 [Thermoguttaceae bacterium]|nr:hypothetical protein [Thermoguttaceae bacterium]
MKSYRWLSFVAAFAVGLLCPPLQVLSPTIPWFVRFMLLVVFLGIDPKAMRPCLSHLALLAFNVGVPLLLWKLFALAGRSDYGLIAFFTAVAPTATAAPVVIGFLGRKVEYVTTALLITTVGTAAALVPIIPIVVDRPAQGLLLDVAARVSGTIFLPLFLALVIRVFFPKSKALPNKLRKVVFASWLCVLAIILSGASNCLRGEGSISILPAAALISLGICVINFVGGFYLGEKNNRREASQALGQKNTSVTVWLAMTYADPITALGPTLYVLWHNGYNAWQMSRCKENAGEKENAGGDGQNNSQNR